MCRSKAQGGQRCYSHAREKYERTARQYEEASKVSRAAAREAGVGQTLVGPHAVKAEDPAWQAYTKAAIKTEAAKRNHEQAIVEYASTKRGQADIRDQAIAAKAQADQSLKERGITDMDAESRAAKLAHAAREGQLLRDTNYLVSRGHSREQVERMYPSAVSEAASRARATR